ncbi:MAG: hypothetical protein HYZ83_07835 [Candidatus Omnitrophica bacterium]|nr:hypothetical protein [Candidatus Omnitrophota bacterium]
MKRQWGKLVGLMMVTLTLEAALSASVFAVLYEGFTPTKDSQAYTEFIKRPVSEHSKLLYLIDRFGDADVQIVYDGHYFSAPFAARVARWFISRNYKKEPAQKWIMRWCNTTIARGNLIWVKLPNEKFRLAREVLVEELKSLDIQIKQSQEAFLKKKETVLETDTPMTSTVPSSAIPRLVAGAPTPKS